MALPENTTSTRFLLHIQVISVRCPAQPSAECLTHRSPPSTLPLLLRAGARARAPPHHTRPSLQRTTYIHSRILSEHVEHPTMPFRRQSVTATPSARRHLLRHNQLFFSSPTSSTLRFSIDQISSIIVNNQPTWSTTRARKACAFAHHLLKELLHTVAIRPARHNKRDRHLCVRWSVELLQIERAGKRKMTTARVRSPLARYSYTPPLQAGTRRAPLARRQHRFPTVSQQYGAAGSKMSSLCALTDRHNPPFSCAAMPCHAYMQSYAARRRRSLPSTPDVIHRQQRACVS